MNCVFCHIGKNSAEEEYRIIYIDENYIAMLVSHPESKGHFILFPRKHCSELQEMQDKYAFFDLAIKLAEVETKLLKTDAYTLKLNNNVFKLDKDPLHVAHVHIHVIPKYSANDSNGNKPRKAGRDYFVQLKKTMSS